MVEALELADVGPGVRVLDLGCGDGSALLVAAEMGASVAGIEGDGELADEAASNLYEAGIEADVWHADLFDESVPWDADVFLTYLAPATLSRLRPRLTRHRGTALVTIDFDVPGLIPTRRGDAARLYRLPGRRRPLGDVGWDTAGTLVATVPDVQSLTCLELAHPAGPVDVEALHMVSDTSRNAIPLERVATVLTGADEFDEAGWLAIDIRWEEPSEGTIVAGVLHVAGVGDHAVFAIATDHEDESQWDLTSDGVDRLREALAGPTTPATAAEMVDAANG